jgi:hypothetical protein
MESKRELLAAELQRYFGETCPALAARWEAAIVGLAPPFLRELVGRLKELEAGHGRDEPPAQSRSSPGRRAPSADRAGAGSGAGVA